MAGVVSLWLIFVLKCAILVLQFHSINCSLFVYINYFRIELLSVPDLETVKFKVLSRRGLYEIREVEVCV